ncbi:MBL fold metallo-hydrolase [Patescibacteria group bacterium]|nr:MBL fold metallo-hydrolase [Patescibacteria group bacterium]
MDYLGIKIDHFEQSGFRIKAENKVIYLDPSNLKAEQVEKADFILITHEHFDHCSVNDLKKIIAPETIVIAPAQCQQHLKTLKVKEIIYVYPNQALALDGIKVETVPAYNLDKFRSTGMVYHPKEDEKVGYIVEIQGVRIYHAGDTDNIPEMAKLSHIDIAMVPVSGTYVMTWQEAVAALEVIKPKLAIPMHYGSIIGSKEDAEKLKNSADCPVEII